MLNKILLHLEGLAVFVLSVYLYGVYGYSWGLFFILLLAPDLSALGYLLGNKIGAVCYNTCHTYIAPISIVIIGVILSSSLALAIGFIWTAHIGIDRALGYGLKYTTEFKDTHLGRV